jgi:hypothetical protein
MGYFEKYFHFQFPLRVVLKDHTESLKSPKSLKDFDTSNVTALVLPDQGTYGLSHIPLATGPSGPLAILHVSFTNQILQVPN